MSQQTKYSLESLHKRALLAGYMLCHSNYNFWLTNSRGLKKTPSTCPCGEKFDITDAFHCAKRGYTHVRHNEIGDIRELMNDVCYDVEIEPKLQPLQGETFPHKTTSTDHDAQLDIKANRIWET